MPVHREQQVQELEAPQMDTGAAGAARENDVLQASHATDRATMSRVAEALRGQLDGQVIPAAAVVIGPVELLERRTCTLLGPIYAKGQR